LNYLQLTILKEKMVPVKFTNKIIRMYKLRHFVVENRILLIVKALQDKINQADIANMRNYLKRLNLSIGLVVNFGKTEVQISGVRYCT